MGQWGSTWFFLCCPFPKFLGLSFVSFAKKSSYSADNFLVKFLRWFLACLNFSHLSGDKEFCKLSIFSFLLLIAFCASWEINGSVLVFSTNFTVFQLFLAIKFSFHSMHFILLFNERPNRVCYFFWYYKVVYKHNVLQIYVF